MPLQSRFMPIESVYFPWEDMTDEWQGFTANVIKIFNTSLDYYVELSFDGVNFNDYIPSVSPLKGTSCIEIDATVNSPYLTDGYFKQGLIIYGRYPDLIFFNNGFVIIEGYTPYKE